MACDRTYYACQKSFSRFDELGLKSDKQYNFLKCLFTLAKNERYRRMLTFKILIDRLASFVVVFNSIFDRSNSWPAIAQQIENRTT